MLRGKLSRLLVVLVLVFSGFITLVLTAIQLYLDYRYDLSLIDRRLQQIEISNLESVSRHVWTLNSDALTLQLEGLLRQPDMVQMLISGPDGNILVQVGEAEGDEDLLSRSYPIEYRYRGDLHQLGMLTAVASLEGVYQRLWDTFLVILASQAVKTFLVSVFLLFVFRGFITRHLDKLVEEAGRADLHRNPEPWELDRPRRWYNRGDELDKLLTAFNRMRQKLHATYDHLVRSRSALEQAQQIARLGNWEWDRRRGLVHWSESAARILGWGEQEFVTENMDRYLASIHPDDRRQVAAGLSDRLQLAQPLSCEHRIIAPNGDVRHIAFRLEQHRDPERQADVMVGVVHDVTEYYQQREALEYMANYDALTDLPNRWKLQRRLDEMTARGRSGRRFCLAVFDLDGFKEINDNLGHIAGDQLLRQIKPRLLRTVRDTDLVARLGGDEFAVVFDPVHSTEEVIGLVENTRRALAESFDLNGTHIQVGASAGVSMFPDHAEDADELLKYADVAMYKAKKSQSGSALYDPHTSPYGRKRITLLNDMGRALRNEELVLYYQPKVEAATGRVCAAEVLIRWQHPEQGFVPPSEFIPLFEMSDIIHELTDHVMHRAMQDVIQWHQRGHEIKLGVNISARDLMDRDLPRRVRGALDSATISSPDTLQLEITENDLMTDPERAKRIVESLASLGVGLAIDDFGTGYSSLSYLKHLRVQELKIDRSFVRDMTRDKNDAQIVKSTIELAHNLGLVVTAEGVEDGDTLSCLAAYGCEMAQGYHIAKPMPAELFGSWLDSHGGDEFESIEVFQPA